MLTSTFPLTRGPYSLRNKGTGNFLFFANGSSADNTAAAPTGEEHAASWTFGRALDGYWLQCEATGTYLTLNAQQVVGSTGTPTAWKITAVKEGYELHPTQNAGFALVESSAKDILVSETHEPDASIWEFRSIPDYSLPAPDFFQPYEKSPRFGIICNLVKNAMAAIDSIFDTLDHPIQVGSSGAAVDYSRRSIADFEIFVAELLHNFGTAYSTAAQWKQAVEQKQVSVKEEEAKSFKELDRLKAGIALADGRIAELQDGGERLGSELLRLEEQAMVRGAQVGDARRAFQEAVDKLQEFTEGLSLAFSQVFGGSAEEDARRNLEHLALEVENKEWEFNQIRSQINGINERANQIGDDISNARSIRLQIEEEIGKTTAQLEEVGSQATKLTQDAEHLASLATEIGICAKALSASFGNDQRTQDATVAQVSPQGNVKDLIMDLKLDPGLAGHLGGLDEIGLAEVTANIKCIAQLGVSEAK